jgi:hypothetical protein
MTSAIWKVMDRLWRTIFAPIFISLSRSVAMDRWPAGGGVRRRLPVRVDRRRQPENEAEVKARRIRRPEPTTGEAEGVVSCGGAAESTEAVTPAAAFRHRRVTGPILRYRLTTRPYRLHQNCLAAQPEADCVWEEHFSLRGPPEPLQRALRAGATMVRRAPPTPSPGQQLRGRTAFVQRSRWLRPPP